MDGLIILEPWLTLILQGRKTWEIRGKPCHEGKHILLLHKSTAWGECTIKACVPLTKRMFIDGRRKHFIKTDFESLPYKKVYAYVLDDVRSFFPPVRYRHPKGAQVWVKNADSLLVRQENEKK